MVESVLGGFAALFAARTSTGSEGHAERGTRLIIPWQGGWADGHGLNHAIIDGLFGGGFVNEQAWRQWSEDDELWVCFERREYSPWSPTDVRS